MLRYLVLTALSLMAAAAPAEAFSDNPYEPGGVYTGGLSGNKSHSRPYSPDPYNPPSSPVYREWSGTTLRLSGSGNSSARLAVVQNDDELRQRMNRGEVQARDLLISRIDLNDDGRDEILLYNESPSACVRGECEFSVYQVVRGQPLRPLLQGFMARSEIVALNQFSRGWRDLLVKNRRGNEIVLSYNGRSYAPPRRTSSYDWPRDRRDGWQDDWRNDRWDQHR